MYNTIAHISSDGLREQTLDDHLGCTASLAGDFAAAFGCRKQAVFMGLLHDIGKTSDEFERRLHGGPLVDHSTAGAYEAALRGAMWAAEGIAGHHAGLPDIGAPGISDKDTATLIGRLHAAHEHRIPRYTNLGHSLTIPPDPSAAWGKENGFVDMMFMRMLFSCLVDADYLDTERFMTNCGVNRPIPAPLKELREAFGLYTAEWQHPRRTLDKIRTDIFTACTDQAFCPPGLFTLTVPTGGGKTTASFAFALNHAIHNEMSRIIYVMPFTSIIDQTADVFDKAIGRSNVLKHYGEAVAELRDHSKEDDNYSKLLAAENWDSPVVVTTAVQFFESLLSAHPSKCRKLHNIANSIIIFDEAQTIPVEHLEPCCAVIATLIRHFKCSVILSTATQPGIVPIIQRYGEGLTATELCRDKHDYRPNIDADLRKELKRCDIRFKEPMTCTELIKELKALDNVLCIINSRADAQRLYSELPEEGAYCLSTLMYPAHRRRIIAEIRSRLAAGKICRVISTSMIEAGVDIDFKTVYRELTGLDSVIQSAGRCNRENRRDPAQCVTYVFSFIEKTNEIKDVRACITTETMLRARNINADIDDPAVLNMYFKGIRNMTGRHDIQHVVEWSLHGHDGVYCPFRQIDEKFRLIPDRNHKIYVNVPESKDMISAILSETATAETFRKVSGFAADVPETIYERLLASGDIKQIDGLNAAVLINEELYSEKTGLIII